MNDKQKQIIQIYTKLAEKSGHHPSRSDLIAAGVSRERIRNHFGNFEKLKKQAIEAGVKEAAPKVLLFDIETAPIEARVWQLKQNGYIGLNQIVQDWSILSWSAKWLGNDEIMYQDLRDSRNVRNDKKLLKDIWKLLDECDIVVTQNGKSFDSKKLNARFIINGFTPPSSYQHIDTKRLAKKHFGFTSNSLEYMSKALNLPYKKKAHKKFPGQELWNECLLGNIDAWKEMEDYNKHDVLSLEALYKRLAPWDDATVLSSDDRCQCGAASIVKNGFFYNKSRTRKSQRYVCQSCGHETRDSKSVPTGKKRK